MIEKETINSYRIFARNCLQLKERILWDINPISWSARSKLKESRNSCVGQKAVIIGNGPSLLKHDLTLLKNTFTFGQNKINLLFDKTSFRPSCIVSIDPIILNQNADFYNATSLPLFLSKFASSFIKKRKNVGFLYISQLGRSQFAQDCSLDIGTLGSVTHVSLQLAFHMGFSDVALIGCDHNYKTGQAANTLVKASGKDENHFDPNYVMKGQVWQVSDMQNVEIGYKLAKDTYAHHGRRVVNCTEGGKLEVFERNKLELWLNDNCLSKK